MIAQPLIGSGFEIAAGMVARRAILSCLSGAACSRSAVEMSCSFIIDPKARSYIVDTILKRLIAEGAVEARYTEGRFRYSLGRRFVHSFGSAIGFEVATTKKGKEKRGKIKV